MYKFLPFGEALAVAHSLGLASRTEWNVWYKGGMRPPNVPPRPDHIYKDHGWQGWGHWLGPGNHAQGKPNNNTTSKKTSINRNTSASFDEIDHIPESVRKGVVGHQCNPGPVNVAAAMSLEIIRKRMAKGYRRAGYGVHWAPNR